MTQAVELDLASPEGVAAGARSSCYSLLAEAFAFPDEPTASRLASGAWLEDFEEAAAHLPFAYRPAGPRRATASDLPPAYIHLFEVGAGRPFCPLYEGAHRGGRMKIMEELVRFFEHFGLKPAAGDHPDHVCAEFQFMHYLAFKEAAAAGTDMPREDLRLAQRDFLYRHLCKWLPRLYTRMEQAREPSPFYSSLASTAAELCAADLDWLKRCQEIPDHQIRPLPD